jgi:N-succinyldiaminopimelate aminotransferase
MRVASRLKPFGESVFSQMTRLAQQHGAINLGQGFPDTDGPEWLKEAAANALRAGSNQLAPPEGNHDLRNALAVFITQTYGLSYCPDTEITICNGATEGLAATFLAILSPGDEVIVLEPFFDCYRANVLLAGGVPRFLATVGPDFEVDLTALKSLINPKTRALLLNSPWNPTGRVWSLSQLGALAQIVLEHPRMLVVTDEVYEHIRFGPEHHPMARCSGMRSRTVMISSFSKTLSMTGWKVGWVAAPPEISTAVRACARALTGGAAAPLQAACASVLHRLPEVCQELAEGYRSRCTTWLDVLHQAGLEARMPEGTFFLLTDVRPLGFHSDMDFCLRLPAELGVAAFPVSTLYSGPDGQGWVRWAFCKTVPTLIEATTALCGRAAVSPAQPSFSGLAAAALDKGGAAFRTRAEEPKSPRLPRSSRPATR